MTVSCLVNEFEIGVCKESVPPNNSSGNLPDKSKNKTQVTNLKILS